MLTCSCIFGQCPTDTVKDIFSETEEMKTFTAEFVQSYKSRAFSGIRESRGYIFFKMPHFFMIHTLEPVEEIMLIEKDRMKLYNVAKDTLREEDINRYMDDFRLFYMFNVDYNEIQRSYFIRCIEDETYRISLTPKNSRIQKRLLNIIIIVSRENLVMEKISYYFRNEEEIHISFNNIILDAELEESVFSINQFKNSMQEGR